MPETSQSGLDISRGVCVCVCVCVCVFPLLGGGGGGGGGEVFWKLPNSCTWPLKHGPIHMLDRQKCWPIHILPFDFYTHLLLEKGGLIIYVVALKKWAIRHAHSYYAIYRKLPPPPPHPHSPERNTDTLGIYSYAYVLIPLKCHSFFAYRKYPSN